MPERSVAIGRIVGAGLVALALLGGGAFVWSALQQPPEGPQPVAYDRVRCARCGMLVSEPRFAAQLHTPDGDVLYFDDPGCLFLYRHEHPDVAAVWFRDSTDEGWLAGDEAGFASVMPTPMSYGFAAVPADTPGAVDARRALLRVLAREARREPPPGHARPGEREDAVGRP